MAKRFTAIGLMSGTSADGVDAAVIETDGTRVFATGAFLTVPMPAALRQDLLALMGDPDRAEHGQLDDLDARVTDLHADAVRLLLARAKLSPDLVDVVGFHGQTILHRPERRLTRQLGDGARLARAMGIPVVNRFRHADVAAGGQGAPLVPLFHAALAHDLASPIAVLNLGGVANVTALDDDFILAFDTGPANALIDDWVGRHMGAAYDEDGRIAGSGAVDAAALAALLDHPYFDRAPPKSLDRNSFSAAPVQHLSLADGAATLTAFTVATVGLARAHLPKPPARWLVAGGGRHNPTIMQMLRTALGVSVDPVEAVGWNGDALEAQAFGFLAVRSLLGLPLSLPQTTGVPTPMPGGDLHR